MVVVSIAGFGACSALLCGADDGFAVGAAAAGTTLGAAAIPPLILHVGLPLYRSYLGYTDWEVDHPVQAAVLFWSVFVSTVVMLFACVACFCCG